MPLMMNVVDLWKALGLPAYPSRPPYRQPPGAEIPDPEQDMEDVDHVNEQGEDREGLVCIKR